MSAQPFDPDRSRLVAAVQVRRDVQEAAQRAAGEMPLLGTAMAKLGMALSTTRQMGIGEEPEELYRNLIDLMVTAERYACALRAAHPDLTLRTA